MIVRVKGNKEILTYGKGWYSEDYNGIYDIIFGIYLTKVYTSLSSETQNYFWRDTYRDIDYKLTP